MKTLQFSFFFFVYKLYKKSAASDSNFKTCGDFKKDKNIAGIEKKFAFNFDNVSLIFPAVTGRRSCKHS